MSSPEVDNKRGWATVGAMSTARFSSPEVDNGHDEPTVGAMSTAWLSSPEVDNEQDGPTVGAMSTAWLFSPEVDNERDGPTVGAMSTARLSSGAGLSVIYDGMVVYIAEDVSVKRPHTRHSEARNDILWRFCLCQCSARKFCYLIDSYQLSNMSHHPRICQLIVLGFHRSEDSPVKRLCFVACVWWQGDDMDEILPGQGKCFIG